MNHQPFEIEARRISELRKANLKFIDLTNSTACVEAIAGLDPVTHLVYAAVYEEPDLVNGWRSAAQMETNRAMLENLLEPRRQPSKRHRPDLQVETSLRLLQQKTMCTPSVWRCRLTSHMRQSQALCMLMS